MSKLNLVVLFLVPVLLGCGKSDSANEGTVDPMVAAWSASVQPSIKNGEELASPDTDDQNESGEVTKKPSNKNVIVSDGPITIRDGKVTFGKPELTEQDKKSIYKALSHRKRMAAAIRKNGGNQRGIQQMEDEFNLLAKGYMLRFDLSRAELDKILETGENEGWK